MHRPCYIDRGNVVVAVLDHDGGRATGEEAASSMPELLSFLPFGSLFSECAHGFPELRLILPNRSSSKRSRFSIHAGYRRHRNCSRPGAPQEMRCRAALKCRHDREYKWAVGEVLTLASCAWCCEVAWLVRAIAG
jgi:hypothetical protein